jgi:cobalt/nickel transport system permease protein
MTSSDFLDRFVQLESPIHQLDPRVKTLCVLIFVLAVVLTPPDRFAAFFLFAVLIFSLVSISKVPVSYVLKRSLIIVPFALMIGLLNLFFKPLLVFFNILAKSWLSVLALIMLSSTTDFPTLLKALESLGVPKLLTTILSFMYRYVFTLIDQVGKLEMARVARSYGRRGWTQTRAAGNILGSLFINTYERGERIYQAMLARGYHGHAHTPRRFVLTAADAVFAVFFAASLAAIGWVAIT